MRLLLRVNGIGSGSWLFGRPSEHAQQTERERLLSEYPLSWDRDCGHRDCKDGVAFARLEGGRCS